jgi:superfamily I DNA/RNA helicase
LDRLDRGELVLPNTASLLARYRSLQEALARVAEGKGQALADVLFAETKPWAESIHSALDEPAQYPTARKLHAALVTAITQPELPTDVDYVRIMSLHKSKGLTADLVVVAGCVEGLIPTWDDDATPQEIAATLEEQRRLFYVAMTRPRRTLVLSSVTRLSIALAYKVRARIGAKTGGSVSTIPSRFLDELGPSRPAAIAGHRIVP